MTNESNHQPRFNAEFWHKIGSKIDISRPQKLLFHARMDNNYRVSVNETFYLLNIPTTTPGSVQTLAFDYYLGLILVNRSTRALLESLAATYDEFVFTTSRAKCEFLKLGKTAIPLIMGFHSYVPEIGPTKQNANWYAGHHLINFYLTSSKRTELNFRHDLSLLTRTAIHIYQKQTERIKKVSTLEYQYLHYTGSLAGFQIKISDYDIVLESIRDVSIPSYASNASYRRFLRRACYVETHREMFAEYPLASQIDDYFGIPPFVNDSMK